MEKVNFKIELEGHGWEDKWPDAVISVDNKVYINMLVPYGVNFYEFDVELSDEGEHALSIAYTNKDYREDIVFDDTGSIVKSKFLVVKNISVDDIELTHNIIYYLSSFTVTEGWYMEQHSKDPKSYPLVRKEELALSWNGVWKLPFKTPIYIWLLENI